MTSRSTVDLEGAARQFAQWRAGRPRGARIPESLWDVAVAVASQQGVSRTATTLSLDYYGLKERLDGAVVRGERRCAGGVRFVEMPLAAGGSGSGCVMEYSDEQGRQLRVELHGGVPESLEALARGLLGRDRP